MTENVSNPMTRGQGNAVDDQIEIACKRLGEDPQEVVKKLLGKNFFSDVVRQHLLEFNKGMLSDSTFSVNRILNSNNLCYGLSFSDAVRTKLFTKSDERSWERIDAYHFTGLSTYVLPEKLSDNEIKGLTDSYPLRTDEFWKILHLLTYLSGWTWETLGVKLLLEGENHLMHITNSPGEGEFYTISLKLTVPDGKKPFINVDLLPFDKSKRNKGDIFIYLAYNF